MEVWIECGSSGHREDHVKQFEEGDCLPKVAGNVASPRALNNQEGEELASVGVKAEPVQVGGGRWSGRKSSAICGLYLPLESAPAGLVVISEMLVFDSGLGPCEAALHADVPHVLNLLQASCVKRRGSANFEGAKESTKVRVMP